MINHKANCVHAQTPAARKACRKAAKSAPVVKVPTVNTGRVGKGKATHMIEGHGQLTRCGISTFTVIGEAPLTSVTCKSCAAKYGHAHS